MQIKNQTEKRDKTPNADLRPDFSPQESDTVKLRHYRKTETIEKSSVEVPPEYNVHGDANEHK